MDDSGHRENGRHNPLQRPVWAASTFVFFETNCLWCFVNYAV